MKKESIFLGAATAIVTPMTAQGVDYPTFERIAAHRCAAVTQAVARKLAAV